MNNPRSVAGIWATYAEHVLPTMSSKHQAIETRRAFYAGAKALLSLVVKQLEPGQEATEADLKFMDSVEEELNAFSRAVFEGKA